MKNISIVHLLVLIKSVIQVAMHGMDNTKEADRGI